jgi:hypothetical protein
MNTQEVKKTADAVTDDVLREYRTGTKGTAFAYIRLARKMASSGISKTKALELVNAHFPTESKAFLDAQARGEKLPILFPKPGPSYEEKRKVALSRGGRIN